VPAHTSEATLAPVVSALPGGLPTLDQLFAFAADAERRARTLLVLSAVAGAEGIQVPEELIDEEVRRAQPQVQGQRKLEAYLASERGRRAIRASLRRSLVVEKIVEDWFDGNPGAWPAWGPERPPRPAASAALSPAASPAGGSADAPKAKRSPAKRSAK